MAVIEIPWGDGTSDNIHLTHNGTSGSAEVNVSSDPNNSGAARVKVLTFRTNVGNATATLTVNQEYIAPAGDVTFVPYDNVVSPDYEILLPYTLPNHEVDMVIVASKALLPTEWANKVYINIDGTPCKSEWNTPEQDFEVDGYWQLCIDTDILSEEVHNLDACTTIRLIIPAFYAGSIINNIRFS